MNTSATVVFCLKNDDLTIYSWCAPVIADGGKQWNQAVNQYSNLYEMKI